MLILSWLYGSKANSDILFINLFSVEEFNYYKKDFISSGVLFTKSIAFYFLFYDSVLLYYFSNFFRPYFLQTIFEYCYLIALSGITLVGGQLKRHFLIHLNFGTLYLGTSIFFFFVSFGYFHFVNYTEVGLVDL